MPKFSPIGKITATEIENFKHGARLVISKSNTTRF